jgi:hypothetical protein
MAGTLNATTLSGISTLNAASGVLATQNGMTGIAKAWVNYNGSAQTISGSFNVSSVTYNSTGNYTVNFTTAMANANYAVATCARRDPAISDNGNVTTQIGGATPTTSAVRVLCNRSDFVGAENPTIVCVTIFSS